MSLLRKMRYSGDGKLLQDVPSRRTTIEAENGKSSMDVEGPHYSFHALFLIAWLADGDSLMCCIVIMGRQIAKMFSISSL